jgi:hypothetical protein
MNSANEYHYLVALTTSLKSDAKSDLDIKSGPAQNKSCQESKRPEKVIGKKPIKKPRSEKVTESGKKSQKADVPFC